MVFSDFTDIELEDFNECPICYEELINYVKLECNHNFCLKCHTGLVKNKQSKCPLCRNDIVGLRENIYYINELTQMNTKLKNENTNILKKIQIITKQNLKLSLLFIITLSLLFIYILVDIRNMTSKENNYNPNNPSNATTLGEAFKHKSIHFYLDD